MLDNALPSSRRRHTGGNTILTTDYDASDALLHYVFKQTQGDAWFKPSEESVQGGVCLRVNVGQYRVFPYENTHLEPFEAAVRGLNPLVAVKVRSAAIHAVLANLKGNADVIALDESTRVQVLESISWLSNADKDQGAAFIRDERTLIVWAYHLDNIIPACRDLEEKLMRVIWAEQAAFPCIAAAPPTTSLGSETNSLTASPDLSASVSEKRSTSDNDKWSIGSDKKTDDEATLGRSQSNSFVLASEVESAIHSPTSRPLRMFAPVYSGLAAALSLFFLGNGINSMIQEIVLDGSYLRLALLVTAPFLLCVSIFFSSQIIGNLSMLLGPVSQYHQNSRYYSAKAPLPGKSVDTDLPHVTIELPVYKESLQETIAPTVFSIKAAMRTYARQGGASTIFIHDDGLQLLSEDDRKARIAFYAEHNIGWVARPKHDSSPDGFKRAGRFKKASNMNYGLALSLKLEKHLASLQAEAQEYGEHADDDLEERAMNMAIEEMYQESGRRWRPWACNAKSLRVGQIILIVDADTEIPEDCFRDAAREFSESPEVAIIQHECGVMQVAHHFFENGIAYFTRRMNKTISLGCANGDMAPFIGHNAFLRWSAVQDAAFVDEDGVTKLWSESKVSEDFDMALRLQLKGYVIRWATYSKGGFKEGVSLSCVDEINRWQKYAYGCNELIFNPLISWLWRGPINKQFRTFVWSDAPVNYKISMMAYMFSYYGLGAAAALSIMNYFLLGWGYNIDRFYERSFEIWLACTVVFPIAGCLGFSLLEYRLGQKSLHYALFENFLWMPFLFVFFGGLSMHVSQALLSHIFSYNITWGSTKKESEQSNFWIEIPGIFKRFWWAFIVCVVVSATMAILSTGLIPSGWRIQGTEWSIIVPIAITLGCHVLYPFVLNPWLLNFKKI